MNNLFQRVMKKGPAMMALVFVLGGGACNQSYPQNDVLNSPLLFSAVYSFLLSSPTVLSTFPTDSTSSVKVNQTILINFSTSMDTSTLTAISTSGTCSGSLQISSDEFSTCIGGVTGTDSENKSLVFVPNTSWFENTTFKIKVTTDAKDASGQAMIADFIQSTGYTTFNPRSISGMVLWLRADNSSAVLKDDLTVAGDGDSVNTWTDNSGQGNSAQQTSSTLQPTLQTNYLNSKPALLFDGVDDLMEVSSSLIHNSSGATILMVVQMTGAAFNTGDFLFGNSTAATGDRFGLQFDASSQASFSLATAQPVNISTSATINRSSSSDALIIAGRASSGNMLVADMGYVGSVDTTNWAGFTLANDSSKYIGALEQDGVVLAGSHFNVGVAEIMVLNNAVSDSDHLSLACHLANKYNLSYNGCTD